MAEGNCIEIGITGVEARISGARVKIIEVEAETTGAETTGAEAGRRSLAGTRGRKKQRQEKFERF